MNLSFNFVLENFPSAFYAVGRSPNVDPTRPATGAGRPDRFPSLPSSLPQKNISPQFSAHIYCGQTAGQIKIPLGTEVCLGPGDIVLDGDSAPHGKGTAAPHFSAYVYYGQTVGHLS